MSSADLDPAVGLCAWIEAAEYTGLRAGRTRLERDGPVWMARSARPFTNPLPRSFEHTKLFYAYEPDPGTLLPRIQTWLDAPDEEHVLLAFGRDADGLARRFSRVGYALGWTFAVYAFPLGGALAAPELDDPGWELRPTRELREVDAMNATDPPYRSHPELLGDPQAFEVMVFEGERPLAKGHFVQHDSGIVHVLGMFTLPELRQRGLARAVIRALHREAAARGAPWSVLNASLEAARLDVYPALGYSPFVWGARLVPER